MPDDQKQQQTTLQAHRQQDSRAIRAPSIYLPKDGSAIRGIGEKFGANPVTGTVSMSVPIATSPGRSGVGPQLSLSYDAGTDNGLFGLGWNFSLLSPSRARPAWICRAISILKNLMYSFSRVPRTWCQGMTLPATALAQRILSLRQPVSGSRIPASRKSFVCIDSAMDRKIQA